MLQPQNEMITYIKSNNYVTWECPKNIVRLKITGCLHLDVNGLIEIGRGRKTDD